MWLAVDVGNTNATVAVVREGRLEGSRGAIASRDPRPEAVEAELAALLRGGGHSLEEIEGLVLASVVPDFGEALLDLARRRGLPVLEATAESIPIPVRVDRPDEVGADRLVNAFAAGRLYGRPAIVVDFGTATTFDVVAADGAYIGGAIAPGLELGLDALASRTARLPRIQLALPRRAIGTDTVEAMRSGAVFGYVGLTRELLRRIGEELEAAHPGQRIQTILTGGLSAADWIAELPPVDAVDPDLTLRGLALMQAEVPVGLGR
jgi:type III pantothenate kinase